MVHDRVILVAPPRVRYIRDLLDVWTLCPIDEKNSFVIVKPRNFSADVVRQFRFNTTEAFQSPGLLVLCGHNHAYDIFGPMGRRLTKTAKVSVAYGRRECRTITNALNFG